MKKNILIKDSKIVISLHCDTQIIFIILVEIQQGPRNG